MKEQRPGNGQQAGKKRSFGGRVLAQAAENQNEQSKSPGVRKYD
jgi:hypothetical protein